MTRRKAILVLGMHRSGTSVITRILNLLGAEVAKNLMPPTSENPSGYWESVRIARFNNKLLQLANSSWQDDNPIASEWFDSESTTSYVDEGIHLLEEEFGQSEVFVLKCPRISILLPFWKEVLKKANVETYALLVIRDPFAVAASLAARNAHDSMKPAAIAAFEKSILLWLRYIFDAEFYSRDLPRQMVFYETLLTDWKATLKQVLEGFVPGLPTTRHAAFTEIDELLHPQNRRKKEDKNLSAEYTKLIALLKPLQILKEFIAYNNVSLFPIINDFKADFDRLIKTYSSLRLHSLPTDSTDHWAFEILKEIQVWSLYQDFTSPQNVRGKRVLFISNIHKENIGQIFRVNLIAQCLRNMHCETHYLKPTDDLVSTRLESCNLVVIFRSGLDHDLEKIMRDCKRLQIPVVYSVDDILFEPSIMKIQFFDFLRDKSISFVKDWEELASKHLSLLRNCDAALLTTKPLAIAAQKHCPITFVLPNMVDEHFLETAEKARKKTKPSMQDGIIRIGFAGGTPTHNQNFKQIFPVLLELLQENSMLQLIIVGPVNIPEEDRLLMQETQIIFKPKVPIENLFDQMHEFDINLAPLEVGNPFCETKSELRYVFASLLKIPTVASPVQPLKECIVEGVTGFLAFNSTDWKTKLKLLIQDKLTRERVGEHAYIHTLAKFGPESLQAKTIHVFNNILRVRTNLFCIKPRTGDIC